MLKWFNSQSRLIQIILLLIPVVNWVVEIGVRWGKFFRCHGPIALILAILTIPGGIIIGWLDVVWCLLFHNLFLAS